MFFVLGERLSFTWSQTGSNPEYIEAHFGTLIIDHPSKPLGHRDQASNIGYSSYKIDFKSTVYHGVSCKMEGGAEQE